MDWDTLLTGLSVGAAVLYLVRRSLPGTRRSTGCGGCHGGCSARASASTEEPEGGLVQLDVNLGGKGKPWRSTTNSASSASSTQMPR